MGKSHIKCHHTSSHFDKTISVTNLIAHETTIIEFLLIPQQYNFEERVHNE